MLQVTSLLTLVSLNHLQNKYLILPKDYKRARRLQVRTVNKQLHPAKKELLLLCACSTCVVDGRH